MKKLLCIALSAALILTTLFVPGAFAASDGLEQAILTAKDVLKISDDEYVIDDFSQYDGKYNLSWKSRDDEKTDSISVTVSNGEITSYYKNYSRDYDRMVMPSVDKENARLNAEEFLKTVCPKVFETLTLSNSNYGRYGGGTYSFTYERNFNLVPVENQETYIEVAADSGVVISFNAQYNYNLTFEDDKKAVGFEKAKDGYIKDFGYELKYITRYDDSAKKNVAFLAYVPADTRYGTYLDALTGEKTDIKDLMFEGRSGGMGDSGDAAADFFATNSQKATSEAVLSKEEQKLGEEVANLPKKEDVEKQIRAIDEFKIDSSFVMTNYSVSKTYEGEYYASLEFSNETQKRSDEDYTCKYVRINLTENRIVNFNSYGGAKNGKAGKGISADVCKKNAESFINKYYSDYSKEVVFSENEYSDFNIRFDRFYDGVKVLNNGISFSYNENDGTLEGLYFNRENVDFAPKANIKSIDELYAKILTPESLKLKHIVYRKYTENKTMEQATKLVYALDNDYAMYDANTLEEVTYSGAAPVKISYKYDDIENHYVKPYAEKLAELDIGFEGTSLRPDESITKRDYLVLVALADNIHYPEYSTERLSKLFISRGIIEKEDKDLDSPVTRMDAVRFMINNLGYKEIAAKNSIFKCPFTDIPENMTGYATLGAALGIVSDKSDILDAESNLTRADALIIIYNYLTRE